MSSPMVHAVQSVVTSAALYPLMGAQVVPFGLAVVLIDLDHVIEYVRNTRSYDIRGMFPCCKLIEDNLDKSFLVFNAFHTIEFLSIIALLSGLFPPLRFVLAGMIYHMAFDFFHLLKIGRPSARAYSVFEYLVRVRKQKCISRVYDLLVQDNLNTARVANFVYWAQKWADEKNNPYGNNIRL